MRDLDVIGAGEMCFGSDLEVALRAQVSALRAQGRRLALDVPGGALLAELRRDPSAARSTLVVVRSGSAEFLDDVWECGVLVLASHLSRVSDLEALTGRLQGQERVRLTVAGPSVLSPAERRVLGQVACGESNKQIAKALGLSVSTVHNTLVRVFDKLGLETRLGAALHYWGVSPLG